MWIKSRGCHRIWVASRGCYLSEYIDIKQWEITCAAGRYIRSHEAVQHMGIRIHLIIHSHFT